jgi:two-component system, OmpR family, sensor kinase
MDPGQPASATPTPSARPGGSAREVPSSLFTQIFALVLATVAIAQLINLALLAALPPDPPRIVPIARLAAAIQARDEQALLFRILPAPPFRAGQSGPGATRVEADLALLLGRSPDDVAIDMTAVQGRKFVEYYPQGSERPEAALQGHFRVAVRQADNWLLVEPADRQLFATRERQFLLLFLLSAFAMLPIAWVFARRLAEPFEQFADAAEALGRDPRATPAQVRGPAEVERASDAFRQMQQRLQAYVTDRTQMLGAIAHDLRTPLTRLAFRLETLDEADRARLQGDVAEMESMVQSTLGLARADSQPVQRQRLELGSLVEKAAEDLAVTGRAVTAEALDTLVVDGDPVGLRRLVTNLLDNGEAYGRRAHARVWRDGAMAVIDVDDEGPGLPPGEEERVFEPFYRLERSRSRETGGTGLGLSVARSIARLHGGDVVLSNRAGKGLRARVTIPIA